MSSILVFFSTIVGAAFFALWIVSLINEQYRSIDLLASSFPGIGKFIPVGLEFVSTTATIGILSLCASFTAKDSILVSIIMGH